jgi:uncharacterized protein YbjT (DUF2867 family)
LIARNAQPNRPDIAARDQAAAQAAKAAGVRRLVKLSSMDVRQNVGTGVWHARGEAAIRASGIPCTIVHPAGFMSNALGWASSIKSDGIVRSATGGGKIAFVHPEDIAEVATLALTTRTHEGKSLAITGPEALTYAEMTQTIAAALGKPLSLEPLSEDEVSRRMREEGDDAEIIAAHLSIYRAIREGRLAGVTATVERVTGRRPLTFEQWVRANLHAFR